MSIKNIAQLHKMFGNITTESKKQQLEIQDLKERLLSKGSTISTIEKNLTLNEKIQEVKLMLEATSTSNKHIIFFLFITSPCANKCVFS